MSKSKFDKGIIKTIEATQTEIYSLAELYSKR